MRRAAARGPRGYYSDMSEKYRPNRRIGGDYSDMSELLLPGTTAPAGQAM